MTLGCQGQALKIPKGPSGETKEEKEVNAVAVGCNAGAAGDAQQNRGTGANSRGGRNGKRFSVWQS